MRRSLNKQLMRPQPVQQYTGVLNGVAEDMVARIRHLREATPDGEQVLCQTLVNEFYKWSMECE